MQGTVITSIKCSVQIDTLGPECLSRGEGMYKYKDCLPIPPLSLVDDVLAVGHCGSDSIKLNSIIQSKMDTKKLELGTDKCFQMHIGKNSPETCPELNVHQDIMKTTSSEKYLGDIITNTGKIDQNIQSRVDKANGTINSIISLLEEISFGHHYFEMAILFRNSMLINSLLSSSEVLYGIKHKHIEMLEKCDKDLLVRVFSVPSSCSYEAVYLETGCLPIRFILQGRQLLYYWTLLNKPSEELVKRFFEIQKDFSTTDDWILQIEEDKRDLEINISEQSIQIMKKEAFKKLVKQKLNEKAFEFLFKTKEGHSKTKHLKSFLFQNYLQTENISTKEKKLLFSLRTRSVDVKTNYKNKYKFSMQCSLCENASEEESEMHLLKCIKISQNINPNIDLKNASYKNIFSENIDDQVKITKIFDAVFRTKNSLLNF